MPAMTVAKRGRRRASSAAAAGTEPLVDYPYVMKLKDGRMIYVEVPGRWTVRDRSGEIGFLPPAVKLLDHIQVLAMSMTSRPVTPGYLKTLREALGLTQTQMGERVGVDKMTVWRWEQGQLKPSKESLAALEKLRRQTVRKGVMISA